MFNKTGYPKTGFSSAKTIVAAGAIGTTVFFDEVVTTFGPNYCIDAGAANALVATLTAIVSGVLPSRTIHPEAGMRVIVKTRNALQAGANTFNLNSHGTDSIVKQSSGALAHNLTTVIASGAMLEMVFDGTYWQVVGQ